MAQLCGSLRSGSCRVLPRVRTWAALRVRDLSTPTPAAARSGAIPYQAFNPSNAGTPWRGLPFEEGALVSQGKSLFLGTRARIGSAPGRRRARAQQAP